MEPNQIHLPVNHQGWHTGPGLRLPLSSTALTTPAPPNSRFPVFIHTTSVNPTKRCSSKLLHQNCSYFMDNRCVGVGIEAEKKRQRCREEETKCQGGRCCCGLKNSFFQLYFKMGCWSINAQFVFLLGWLDSLSLARAKNWKCFCSLQKRVKKAFGNIAT